MDRRKLVAKLLADRGELLVVASIGSPTYDVAACGDDARNFYIWSGLGCTPMVGLGLALAQPQRRIAVFTGDGDVLMALGSLATIGVKQPKNLAIVCLDNGHYSASGMQPSATAAGVDLAEAARACKLRSRR
jgi:thiamine pyrophosphate-dependent acetolactate synthase large subunit-like protein